MLYEIQVSNRSYVSSRDFNFYIVQIHLYSSYSQKENYRDKQCALFIVPFMLRACREVKSYTYFQQTLLFLTLICIYETWTKLYKAWYYWICVNCYSVSGDMLNSISDLSRW